ncbi:MAG: hypothetical protein M0R03_21785 [Novosphingobium sp.]|nr:hypothetical protein [Novosphingobium sp.]
MSSDKIITLPKELRNAPQHIKEAFKIKMKIRDEMENHPNRYYSLSDEYGDTEEIDCTGIFKINMKKVKQKGLKMTDYDRKKIEENSKLMMELKMQMAKKSRTINAYLSGNSRKNVFHFKKGDILEKFGRYQNIDQVWQWLKDEGYSAQRNKVVEFYKENLDEIKDRRYRFQLEEKDFYLATTTGRLESLTYLYGEMVKRWESTHNKGYASEARSIIEQVRKEIKGDEVHLTVDGKIDLTATIQANRSIQDLNRLIPINMFIVALVAGKRGLNPSDIMSQLTNSFYKQLNGFGGVNSTDNKDFKLPSHYIKSYDWNTISTMHENKDKEVAEMVFKSKMEKFFNSEGVEFNGDMNKALNDLKRNCGEEVGSEIVDVRPIETEVVKEEKEKVKSKRDMLKKILEENKKEKQRQDE